MGKMDVNCLIGHWPFRKLGKNTLPDLFKIHSENGITAGCVSSLNSIFYNDPLEGEAELHAAIKGTAGYSHIATVNPTLTSSRYDLTKCVKLYPVKGVRIYPGYHGYLLSDPCVSALCDKLEQLNLPLFLTLRMEDERLDYLMTPRVLPMDELKAFISAHTKLRVILLNIRTYEITDCVDVLKHPNVFFDTSGFGYEQFNVEKYVAEFGPGKQVYGSLYPLNCLKSSILQVEKADLSDKIKQQIFYDNAQLALNG